MRQAILSLAFLLSALIAASAEEQNGWPNRCPEGTVWSFETGKCEPFKPLMA
jgi:hypothetical protein